MQALKRTLVKNSMSVDFLRQQQSIEEEIEVCERKCFSGTLPYILGNWVLLILKPSPYDTVCTIQMSKFIATLHIKNSSIKFLQNVR